jgi:hypothetical protein
MQNELTDVEAHVYHPAGKSFDASAGSGASMTLPAHMAPLSVQTSLVPRGRADLVLGIVVALRGYEPLVEFPGQPSSCPMVARTVVPLTDESIGHEVVVGFENGESSKPIVLGLIQSTPTATSVATFQADGQRFLVLAEREIVLRCGEASITLTQAGKILIQGEYVLTRARGVNRIRGAAVEIN